MKIESKYDVGQKLWGIDYVYNKCPCCGQKIRGEDWVVDNFSLEISGISMDDTIRYSVKKKRNILRRNSGRRYRIDLFYDTRSSSCCV